MCIGIWYQNSVLYTSSLVKILFLKYRYWHFYSWINPLYHILVRETTDWLNKRNNTWRDTYIWCEGYCWDVLSSLRSHQKWKERRNHYRLYMEWLCAIHILKSYLVAWSSENGHDMAQLKELVMLHPSAPSPGGSSPSRLPTAAGWLEA